MNEKIFYRISLDRKRALALKEKDNEKGRQIITQLLHL